MLNPLSLSPHFSGVRRQINEEPASEGSTLFYAPVAPNDFNAYVADGREAQDLFAARQACSIQAAKLSETGTTPAEKRVLYLDYLMASNKLDLLKTELARQVEVEAGEAGKSPYCFRNKKPPLQD